jgi:hypothetical protein
VKLGRRRARQRKNRLHIRGDRKRSWSRRRWWCWRWRCCQSAATSRHGRRHIWLEYKGMKLCTSLGGSRKRFLAGSSTTNRIFILAREIAFATIFTVGFLSITFQFTACVSRASQQAFQKRKEITHIDKNYKRLLLYHLL